jgi:hypothetical protein
MHDAQRSPFVWRLSLASSPESVFELLDTDVGRERFWALRSRAAEGGFDLEFPGGLKGRVDVVDRQPPTRMGIRYFGSEVEFALSRRRLSVSGHVPLRRPGRLDGVLRRLGELAAGAQGGRGLRRRSAQRRA